MIVLSKPKIRKCPQLRQNHFLLKWNKKKKGHIYIYIYICNIWSLDMSREQRDGLILAVDRSYLAFLRHPR